MVVPKFFIVLLLFLAGPAAGQLCQGSLGDPMVNITFGAGQNPGPPLAAATTNYTYTGTDCPPDGSYTVRNNTSNCFNTSWHTLNADHTGDPGGYFMLVNASVTPSAFYTDTVLLPCASTTYEFAAWMVNVLRPSACSGTGNQPNLTFTIERTDGSVIQSYNTGSIPTDAMPLWKQYGFFFTTPAGVSRVVLRITNNAPGGCGNDLALDDITFRPCGPLATAAFSTGATQFNLCQGQPGLASMSATVSAGYSNPVLQWQQSTDALSWSDIPGANTASLTQSFSAASPASFYYRITVAEAENMAIASCRVASPPIVVRINSRPAVTLSHNSPLCEGRTIQLGATGGVQYNWTGVQGFSASGAAVSIPAAGTSRSGRYYVEVISEANCRATDSVDVQVNPKPVAAVADTMLSICSGDGVRLTASGGSSYLWQPGNGLSASNSASTIASPPASTRYRVVVFNNFSCSDTAAVQVNVTSRPIVSAGADKTIIAGQSVQLQGSVQHAQVYEWAPAVFINDIQSLQPVVSPPADITYILRASSPECGVATDSVQVRVFKKVQVPNSFSPNGDGVNDTWVITALEAYNSFELTVFDRYGMPVYSSRNRYLPWDGKVQGKPLPFGTYYYVLHLKQVNSWLKGSVVIIR